MSTDLPYVDLELGLMDHTNNLEEMNPTPRDCTTELDIHSSPTSEMDELTGSNPTPCIDKSTVPTKNHAIDEITESNITPGIDEITESNPTPGIDEIIESNPTPSIDKETDDLKPLVK